MPVVNPLARELVFKVVYYGPGLGGKTTTLQHIHGATRAEHRGKMVSLATPVDRTLYFDFLPIRVPNVRGLGVRLQLFTVPGQVYYNATRKLVLTGADAVVFVADSQPARLDANLESLQNLQENLLEHGRSLEELPFVLAYNKRDLPDVASVEELEQRLNPGKAPSFETAATKGEGVFETLDAITRAVLSDLEDRIPESKRSFDVEGFAIAEGGLTAALRVAEQPSRVDAPTVARESSRANRRAPDGEVAARVVSGPPLEADYEEAEELDLSDEEAFRQEAFLDDTSEPPAAAARAVESPPPVDGALPSPVPVAPAAEPARPSAGEARGPEAGFSMTAAWPEEDRALAREVEGNLKRREWAAAVLGCASLVRRSLARHTTHAQGESDPYTTTALLVGVDGRRYLWLRTRVASARQGGEVAEADALHAYVLALDVSRRSDPRSWG